MLILTDSQSYYELSYNGDNTELRNFPREHPQAISANKATIQIGKKVLSKNIDPKLEKIIFELELVAGQFDFSSLFESGTNDSTRKSWGANFVYLKPTNN